MRALITGAAGYFGRVLIPALLADTRVTSVHGTDRAGAALNDPRYRHTTLDLTLANDEALEGLLAGVDVLIHLAFQMAPRPGEDPRRINLEAQDRFLRRATTVPRWIVASAAAAYGFAADRDAEGGVLDETSPLVPGSGVAYADHKQALEALLDGFARPDGPVIVRIRPTNVVGPGFDPVRAPQLAGPIMFAPLTRHPIRQQLLHEEDLAGAIATLLTAPAGAYNLAPDDWLTMEEAAKLLGMRYVRMPQWTLRALTDVAWRTGASAFDASWLAFLEHPPIILANAKLRALGWAPRYSTAEALRVAASRVRGQR